MAEVLPPPLPTSAASAGRTPPDPAALVAQLQRLATELGGLSPAALKKAGAWPDRPVPRGSPGLPVWVRAPISLEIVNLSPPATAAVVAHARPFSDESGSACLTLELPGGTRALGAMAGPALPTIESLVAQQLAASAAVTNRYRAASTALQASFARGPAAGASSGVPSRTAAPPWGALSEILRGAAERLQPIAEANASIAGSGTVDDPYTVAPGKPLHVIAPITLGFAGRTVAELSLAYRNGRVVVD